MRLFYFFFLLVFSGGVGAQSALPKMKITSERNANPMQLQDLSLNIYVVGQTAVTTMEMAFYNPNDHTMEGEFEFPLGAGQVVSAFALDINGTMRQGVVVDKQQGRVAFESIVRRGIDPGLLEKTEGNNFKARVFPLPAKGVRRIQIAFEQELSQKNGEDFYFLPLKNEMKLKTFKLRAEIVSRLVASEDKNALKLDFKTWKNAYISEISKENYTLSENISLKFPKFEKSNVWVASEGEKSYFYATLPLKNQAAEQKKLPKKIGILWDNSSSSQKRNIKAEMQLLDEYFKKLQNVEIEVVSFNIKASKPQRFNIKNGDWSALKSALENIPYDGATDPTALAFNQHNDEFLLFSDGIFNFGKEEKFAEIVKFIKRPVYAINSKSEANPDKLSYLSFKTGGAFLDLTRYAPSELLSKLWNENYSLLEIKILSGSVKEVFPSEKMKVENGSFSLAGELISKEAKLRLGFGYGNKITDYQEILIENSEKNKGDFSILKRVWATKKIAQLRLENAPQTEIDALGKAFGIVTEGTSLIVLEELEDYVRYKIVPPSELKQEYFKRISEEENRQKQAQNEAKNREKEVIAQVIKASKHQSEWWQTLFPKKGEKSKKTTEEMYDDLSEEAASSRMEGVPPPPPPPPPSVAMEDEPLETLQDASASKDDDFSEVVVVGAGNQRRAERTGNIVMRGVASPQRQNAQNQRGTPTPSVGIELNAWNPDTPYAKVLQYTAPEKAYETYLKLKEEYGDTPSFYVDAGDYFFKNNQCETAVLVISNLAELNLQEVQLLRILGYKLSQYQTYNLAISVFEKVLKLKEEEPQSYRDLGLALAENGQYNEAVKTLYKVVSREWGGRFNGVNLIAMNEINQIVNTQKNIDTSFIDKALLKNEPVDIRVVLLWDTDNTDMDLWVTDPKGEKCKYDNHLTRWGGKLSNDFTGGYGPEEFMQKKAIEGNYTIEVEYYGTRSQKQLFPVSIRVLFFTHYGTPQQKMKETIIRLSENKSVINVGRFHHQ